MMTAALVSTITLYHGTATRFEKLLPSSRGFFGAGIYLTPDIEKAREYAADDLDKPEDGRVIAVEVQCRNLFVFNAPDAMNETTAVTLLRRLYTGQLLEYAISCIDATGQLRHEISSALKARGFDALQVNFSDGDVEYVLFDSSSIVSENEVIQLNPKEFVKYKDGQFISKTAGAVVVVSKIHAEFSE